MNEPILPVREEDGSTLVGPVVLADSGHSAELVIEQGSIRAISRCDDAADWLCLPPLADLHVHANRAFTLSDTRPRDFAHAIEMTMGLFANFSEAAYRRQAGLLFERAFSHGTTRVRTHADLDTSVGLKAVAGTNAARDAWADRMDIEIVAFASSGFDPATDRGVRMLRRAMEQGADLLGAVPVLYADPAASMDGLLDLAAELGCELDLHLDEHLDADNSWSEYLADATMARGLRGKVTLSHGCALSVLPEADRLRAIDKLVAADVTLITLPTTNLYLQDRRRGTPLRRGLTCVQEYLRAGGQLRIASDNVRDAFYPFGDADLLDTAAIAVLATQVDEAGALIPAICNGRATLAPDDPADLVLLRATSLDAALAQRPVARAVMRHGRVIPCAGCVHAA